MRSQEIRYHLRRGLGEIGETVILFNIEKYKMEEVTLKIIDVQVLENGSIEKAKAWSKKEGWFYLRNRKR